MSFGPLRKVSDPPIKVIRVYPVTPVSSVVKIFVHGSSQRNRLFGREFTALSLGLQSPLRMDERFRYSLWPSRCIYLPASSALD